MKILEHLLNFKSAGGHIIDFSSEPENIVFKNLRLAKITMKSMFAIFIDTPRSVN